MDSPRSGFRRAAAASWALAGIGIAGVAGASALAYGDTVKPPSTEPPVDVVEQAPAPVNPVPVPEAPLPPPAMTTDAPPPPPSTVEPAPEVPQTTVAEAPVRTYTPDPTYVPETTVEQAPVTQQTTAPKVTTAPTTQRRALTPTTVMAPNYSPRISRSRGS